MQTVFVSQLKPLLDVMSSHMDLYIPRKTQAHFVFTKYDSDSSNEIDFNNIRVCTPVKEFLFPLRELAAIFPEPLISLMISIFTKSN